MWFVPKEMQVEARPIKAYKFEAQARKVRQGGSEKIYESSAYYS